MHLFTTCPVLPVLGGAGPFCVGEVGGCREGHPGSEQGNVNEHGRRPDTRLSRGNTANAASSTLSGHHSPWWRWGRTKYCASRTARTLPAASVIVTVTSTGRGSQSHGR